MTIQSYNDIIAAMGAGRRLRRDYSKITGAAAYTAGRAYEMMSLNGHPVATTWPGTALACVNTSDSTGDGTNLFGIHHGGNVSPLIKHLINQAALTNAATGVPNVLRLIDLVCYWPGINMNLNTAQTLTGTPTLTRHPNGAGLRFALAARATTGATAHNLSYSYTNQDGTTGRVNPVTVACTPSAIVPHLVHSGVAANNYGPDLPLASGDSGVRNVESITLSAASGTASTAVLMLYRTLMDIPVSIVGLQAKEDYVNQIPGMPIIPDGACLGFFMLPGAAVAANTTITGNLDFIHG